MTIIYSVLGIALAAVITAYIIEECKERKRARRINNRVNEIVAKERTGMVT